MADLAKVQYFTGCSQRPVRTIDFYCDHRIRYPPHPQTRKLNTEFTTSLAAANQNHGPISHRRCSRYAVDFRPK